MNKFKVTFYTVTYFITSLTLGFFTSYFLSEREYNFKYPLFVAGCQNIIHFLLALIISRKLKCSIGSLPCSLVAAVDIGISSYSLRTITLAFYTMVKSSAPCFILLSGFLFGIEKPSIFSFLLMFTIGGGVFLTSYVDTKFNMHGFLLVSFASFMSGFRWAFVQFLLTKKKSRKKNILATIQELCLPISIFLLLCSAKVEGIPHIIKSEFLYHEGEKRWLFNIFYIISTGALSFTLILSEFILVDCTSVVYLSISGIIKELIIICYSVVRKYIKLSPINYAGLFISICGIILFNITRQRKSIADIEQTEGAVDNIELIVDAEVL